MSRISVAAALACRSSTTASFNTTLTGAKDRARARAFPGARGEARAVSRRAGELLVSHCGRAAPSLGRAQSDHGVSMTSIALTSESERTCSAYGAEMCPPPSEILEPSVKMSVCAREVASHVSRPA